MKKIAITGVIASGKSAVSKIIESLGGSVIYTDRINNELLNEPEYIQKLSLIFPNAVNGFEVDRKKIREEIVADENKRLALNTLSHSEIKLRVENMMKNFCEKAIFCEIPLIVESGMAEFFDDIWCVIADRETKIKRIMERDNASKNEAIKIIDCQKSDDELMAISNVVIENNGDYIELKEKVENLYNKLLLEVK